jgi:hypothetical protein
MPPAAEEVTAASVSRTYAAALRAVTDLGLPLRMADQAGGVIETDYVDIAAYDPLAQQYPAPERLVRFRVLSLPHDAGPESSRLTVFAIYAPFREARGTSRQGERAIPRDHPGMDLVRRMVADVRRATGGG